MPAVHAPIATRSVIVLRPQLVLPPAKPEAPAQKPDRAAEPRLRPEARGSLQRWLDLCG